MSTSAADEPVPVEMGPRAGDDRLDVLDVGTEPLHERPHRRHQHRRQVAGAQPPHHPQAPAHRLHRRRHPLERQRLPGRELLDRRRPGGTGPGRAPAGRPRSRVGTATTIGRRVLAWASAATNRARAGSGTATTGSRPMTARSAGSSARSGASAARGGVSVGGTGTPVTRRGPGILVGPRGAGQATGGSDDHRPLLLSGFEELDHRRPRPISGALPRHHDPFARMPVAQALVDEPTVVTVDPRFAADDVEVLDP